MSSNIEPFNNRSPYLITSRKFPSNAVQLEPTLNKMYIEVAAAVNARTVGLYNMSQITTGNLYFNDGDPQDQHPGFRRVYQLDSIASGLNVIPLGFVLTDNSRFVNMYGTANRPDVQSVPIPYMNVTTPTDGIELRVNWSTSNIEIVTTTGNWTAYSAIIVLEYILN